MNNLERTTVLGILLTGSCLVTQPAAAQPASPAAQRSVAPAAQPVTPAPAAPLPTTPAPTTQGNASAAPATTAVPPEALPDAASLDRQRRGAMARYSGGDAARALEQLQNLAAQCGELGTACPASMEAALLRDIGVVQSGGFNQHDKARSAFRGALALDAKVSVEQRYASPGVMQDFESAKSDPTAEDQAAAASPVATEPPKKINGIVLVEGTFKYGGIASNGSVGQLGAAVTAGMTPSRGGFVMALRARGGGYFGNNVEEPFMGLGVLFGGTFARDPKTQSFGYAAGGAGLEYLPGLSRDGFTMHGLVGFVFSEIALGAGFDVTVGGNSTSAVFGLHLGWGHLL